jgi:hypothetical protein
LPLKNPLYFLLFRKWAKAINGVFKKLMVWLVDDKMHHTLTMEFNSWCGMSSVMGVIENIHIAIIKPSSVFVKDYCFNKLSNCLYHSLLRLLFFNVDLFELIFQLHFLCIMHNFLQSVGLCHGYG